MRSVLAIAVAFLIVGCYRDPRLPVKAMLGDKVWLPTSFTESTYVFTKTNGVLIYVKEDDEVCCEMEYRMNLGIDGKLYPTWDRTGICEQLTECTERVAR